MPTPDFVLELRKRLGTDLLWLPGVTGVVFDADERVLLGRRTDTGGWALISGILEPGEQPARAIVREILEETGVAAQVERLSSVWSAEPTVIPRNGDHVQFLDLTFRCRYVAGEAHVADDESSAVGWFSLDGLPEGMEDSHHERIRHARPAVGQPFYRT